MAWAVLPNRAPPVALARPHRRALQLDRANGTFYSLKTSDAFRRWHDATPEDFVYALNGSWFITHNLKLRNAEIALANFYASGYRDAELDAWAGRLRRWASGGARELFVYVDDDARGHAPFDALRLAARLGSSAAVPSPLEGAGAGGKVKT